MSFGLKIINDSGIIQIDDTYQNLFVVRSGTIKTDETGYADLWIDYPDFILTATSSLNGSSCALRDRQGTNWIYKVGSGVPNDDVRWFAFSYPQNIPFNGGFRVNRENGSIAFDSNQRPLIISDFFSVDTPLLPTFTNHEVAQLPKSEDVERPQDIYIPLKEGRTYTAFPIAFMGAVSVVYRVKVNKDGNMPQYEHYCYMPLQRTNGIYFRAFTIPGGDRTPSIPQYFAPRAQQYKRAQQYWVIDITGY